MSKVKVYIECDEDIFHELCCYPDDRLKFIDDPVNLGDTPVYLGNMPKPRPNITDDEKVADWLARLRSDLEVFGFPRYVDTYQRALDIAIKRFMEIAYPNSNVDVAAWKKVEE